MILLLIAMLLIFGCNSHQDQPASSGLSKSSQVDSGSGSGVDAQPADDRLLPDKAAVQHAKRVDEVKHDHSKPLRSVEHHFLTLGAIPKHKRSQRHELQLLPPPKTHTAAPVSRPSPFAPRQAPLPLVSFEGISATAEADTIWYPPDTDGDVSESQYVEVVNTMLAVFDLNGAAQLGALPTNLVWQSFGGPCESNDEGDATVIYDRRAKRWVIAQFTHTDGKYSECVAVSDTADATGSYYRYQYDYAQFNDYPKMALWGDSYLITYNMFTSPDNGTFTGGKICAMRRTALLEGKPSYQQCFDVAEFGGLLAGDDDEALQQGENSPAPIFAIAVASLATWSLAIDWGDANKSTLVGPHSIAVSPFFELCAGFPGNACVPENGSSAALDALSDRLMNRAVYRALHDSVFISHAISIKNGGGVRWYELRGVTSGKISVAQQGTYGVESEYRFISSLAVDHNDDVALGYSVSSSSLYPSIAYATRTPTDATGTMATERIVMSGSAPQTPDGGSRYGDYSSMRTAPDGCTFWYAQEYLTQSGLWGTRIVSFREPTCKPVPQ